MAVASIVIVALVRRLVSRISSRGTNEKTETTAKRGAKRATGSDAGGSGIGRKLVAIVAVAGMVVLLRAVRRRL